MNSSIFLFFAENVRVKTCVFVSTFNRRYGDIASVVDIVSTRFEKVLPVAVCSEKTAATNAAAFAGNFWRNLGQWWRPQEPEPMSFSIVFLKRTRPVLDRFQD